jgi:hypothetical protein
LNRPTSLSLPKPSGNPFPATLQNSASVHDLSNSPSLGHSQTAPATNPATAAVTDAVTESRQLSTGTGATSSNPSQFESPRMDSIYRIPTGDVVSPSVSQHLEQTRASSNHGSMPGPEEHASHGASSNASDAVPAVALSALVMVQLVQMLLSPGQEVRTARQYRHTDALALTCTRAKPSGALVMHVPCSANCLD